MKNPFATSSRTSLTIGTSPAIKKIPSTSARKPNVNSPAPLSGLGARKTKCANCKGKSF